MHTVLTGYVDEDDDGHTVGDEVSLCTDGSLPDGYVAAGIAGDCNDSDPNNWTLCLLCRDQDHDDYFDTCDRYETILGPDCDDSQADNWISCDTCRDADLDRAYVGCDRYVYRQGPDCDDTDPLVRPNGVEIPDNGIDDDCTNGDLTAADGPGLYVDAANIFCMGNGSKQAPFCTIQDALDAAADGDAIFVARDATYGPVTAGNRVGIHGGYAGGAMAGTPPLYHYVAGDWTRDIDAADTTIDAGTSGVAAVSIHQTVHVGLDGLTILGPTVGGGGTYGVLSDAFSPAAGVTVVDCTVTGGSTPNGVAMGVSTKGFSYFARDSIDAGTGMDNTGVSTYGGVFVHNSISGGTAATGTNTINRGVLVTMSSGLLDANIIYGGNGARQSIALLLQVPAIVVNNRIIGGNSTWYSSGVGSPQDGRAYLFNNTISGGSGDELTYGISSYSGLIAVNNIVAAGDGSVEACPVQSRWTATLVHNDLFNLTATCLLSYYDSDASAFQSTSDLAVVNACAWGSCSEASGNVAVSPAVNLALLLTAGSPMIDAGIDPTSYQQELGADGSLDGSAYAAHDCEDDPRPAGGQWDIGADEYVP